MTTEKIIIKILAFTMLCPLLPWSGAFASVILEPVPGVTVTPGAVNRVSIERNGRCLDVYGPAIGRETAPDRILLTHSRRDVVWPMLESDLSESTISAPGAEAERLSKAAEYWEKMAETGQFHDYEQQSTKVITESLDIDQSVQEGDSIKWQGLSFQVIDTPGYTRGAVSYLLEIEKKKIGFTGDLVYGDGQIFDLYSLQDAVPGTRIRGYHGYAGRIGELLQSLKKIKERQCDILVPSRGPVIMDPGAAIERLVSRLEKLYANYLAINAGRWYFKDDYDILAERALGSPEQVDWMTWAETIHDQPPVWIRVINNSRLIISEDQSSFLVDCGSEGIFNEVNKLQEEGAVTSIDGMFITHYHDDHTDFAARAARAFNCPVYATVESADILKNPRAHRLPAMTPNPIPDIRALPDGHKMRWKEFTFEFFHFPGQTIYHDSLLVTRDNGERIFFIGDSFSPSGIDDYCMLNRNLLHEGMGYFYCLDFLMNLPPGVLLINQHIVQPFSFSSQQLGLMVEKLKERRKRLADLFPWDDPNFGIDEQWVRFYPYSLEIGRGGSGETSIRLFNHSAEDSACTVRINAPAGITVSPEQQEIEVRGRLEEAVFFTVSVDTEGRKDLTSDVLVLTADISLNGRKLQQWCEALVKIVF